MRKNVKFIGVAAAALLAVAPVVATSGKTADAATFVNGHLMNFTSNDESNGSKTLNLNSSITAIPGKTTAKEAADSVKFTLKEDGHDNLPVTITHGKVKIYEMAESAPSYSEMNSYFFAGKELKDTDVLELGKNYSIHAEDVKITGMPNTDKTYVIEGGRTWGGAFGPILDAAKLAKPTTVDTYTFQINDPSIKGDAYYEQNGKKLANKPYDQGSITKVTVKVPVTSDSVKISDVAKEITKQNFSFVAPNNSALKIIDTNQNPNDNTDAIRQVAYALRFHGIPYDLNESESDGQFTVPSSGKLSTIKFINIGNNGEHYTLEVTAEFEKTNSANTSSSTTTPSVDNPSTSTTPTSSSTTASNATVTTNNTTNKNDAASSTADNKSETSTVATPSTDAKKEETTKTTSTKKQKAILKHNAYIYTKNHKRVGKKVLKKGKKITVLGKKVKLSNGTLAYRIGKNEYVAAANVTVSKSVKGTKRVLKHNALVYKTSKKLASRKIMKKGKKVTTYGKAVKFKNGKKYYKISPTKKMYIKVVNFK